MTDNVTKNAFSTLPLLPALQDNLATLGYETMTPIQAQSLPPIIAGKDVIAKAKTGSGKTAAFGLGLLQSLNVKLFRVQVLVMCPTRELANQVTQEIRRLARAIHNIKVLTLCGGMPFGPQIGSLEHGAHIVVGTPGRIEEHLRKGNLSLDHLTTVVLDEADRMLDMGFQNALDDIFDYMPKKRQGLLFSATYPKEIDSIAKRVLRNPVTVEAAVEHDKKSIQQHFYGLGDQERTAALRMLLLQHDPEATIIFCNTKRETQEVADDLKSHGFSALALHGDLEQRQRDVTLVRFSNKSASILVATDVAARGLDIADLDMVINYQMSREDEVHIHRVGRTGRAGSEGMACTLLGDNESYKFERLQDYLKQEFEVEELPPKAILENPAPKPAMATIELDGGKKQKVRPGDIMGALTKDGTLEGSQVGKINVSDQSTFIAIELDSVKKALQRLSTGKVKGRSFRVRRIR